MFEMKTMQMRNIIIAGFMLITFWTPLQQPVRESLPIVDALQTSDVPLPSLTPKPTDTRWPTLTKAPTSTRWPTATQTGTPTITSTATITPTPSDTPTITKTSTITQTPTITTTPTITRIAVLEQPCVSYFAAAEGDLKFSCRVGVGEWKSELVDEQGVVGEFVSMKFDPAGNAQISYYDQTNGDLKFASWTGSSWQTSVVDSQGDVGLVTSLDLDAQGQPVIAYLDRTNWTIKVAQRQNGKWQNWVIDDALTPPGAEETNIRAYYFVSMKVDPEGNIMIAYLNHRTLQFARQTEGNWQIETIGDQGRTQHAGSLAIDRDGLPAISFYDRKQRCLKLARWKDDQWNVEIIETNKVGPFSVLLFDLSNHPVLAYADEEWDDLRFSYWNGFSQFQMKLDYEGNVGFYNSMDIAPSGDAYVSYYDIGLKALKVAFQTGKYWSLEYVDQQAGKDFGAHSSIQYRVIYAPSENYAHWW